MEHERDMPDAQTDAPTLQDRLRGKPLYAQCGEESNLPDDAADALDAAQAEIAKLRSALAELMGLMDAVCDGDYTPDSFTTQPARAALAQDAIE
jgi:hypothetical protein